VIFDSIQVDALMEADGWDCKTNTIRSKTIGDLKAFIWFDGLTYIVDLRTDKKIASFRKETAEDAVTESNSILAQGKVSP